MTEAAGWKTWVVKLEAGCLTFPRDVGEKLQVRPGDELQIVKDGQTIRFQVAANNNVAQPDS